MSQSERQMSVSCQSHAFIASGASYRLMYVLAGILVFHSIKRYVFHNSLDHYVQSVEYRW